MVFCSNSSGIFVWYYWCSEVNSGYYEVPNWNMWFMLDKSDWKTYTDGTILPVR